jgi:hypothetical protein
LYAATPLDPLFVLLPILERHRQKVRRGVRLSRLSRCAPRAASC